MTKEQGKTLLESYMPLGLAVITAAVAWGMFTQKLDAEDGRINDIQVQYTSMQAAVIQTQIDVSSIKTSVEFIKNKYQ